MIIVLPVVRSALAPVKTPVPSPEPAPAAFGALMALVRPRPASRARKFATAMMMIVMGQLTLLTPICFPRLRAARSALAIVPAPALKVGLVSMVPGRLGALVPPRPARRTPAVP